MHLKPRKPRFLGILTSSKMIFGACKQHRIKTLSVPRRVVRWTDDPPDGKPRNDRIQLPLRRSGDASHALLAVQLTNLELVDLLIRTSNPGAYSSVSSLYRWSTERIVYSKCTGSLCCSSTRQGTLDIRHASRSLGE